MHMHKDRRDGPPPTPRQLRPPRLRLQILKHNLVHPLIYRMTLHQNLVSIHTSHSPRATHDITSPNDFLPNPVPIPPLSPFLFSITSKTRAKPAPQQPQNYFLPFS
jgi:hypothetical protein